MFLLYIPIISVILSRCHEVAQTRRRIQSFEQLHIGAFFKAPLTLKGRNVLTFHDRKLGNSKTTLVSGNVDDRLPVSRLE